MARSWVRWAGVWVLTGLPALASEPTEAVPVRLEYRAPPACPDSEAFLAAVRARTQRVRPADADEPARTFVVVILSDGARTFGRLQVTEEGRETDSREVSGASCGEVVEALSLTAALSVDPEALLGAPAPPPPPPPPAPPPSSPPPPPQKPPPVPPPFSWWLGADLIGSSAVGPGLIWGGGVGLEIEQNAPGLLRPSARISIRGARNDLLSRADAALATWYALGLDACPLRIGSVLHIEPCATVRAGLLYLRGIGVDHARSVTRSWWSVGGLLRARAVLGPRVAVELAGGLEAPLVRRRFVVDAPRREVAETPNLAATGGIGVAFQLP
jgi:hypothetical protein